MKTQILSLLSISFIYLSKCQNITTPTNYTLSYLKNIDMFQMKCKLDSDCPQYSKCESITKGDQTFSICKFGDFLCPEMTNSYFDNSNVNESCVYVDAIMYDLEKEMIKESFSKEIKPILKICPSDISDCTTEVCNVNSDCLSGVCMNSSCVNNNNMDHEIYRCSVNNVFDTKYTMKCKKANGISCGNDSECYSNICYKQGKYSKNKHCYNTKNNYELKSLLYAVCTFVVFFILYGIHLYIQYKRDK